MLKFVDNYPLKNVTTLSLGGPAKKFVTVKTQAELIEAIKYAKNHQMPYLVIGGGSNLLVSDEGVNCLVVQNEITGIEVHSRLHPKGVIVSIKSGTLLPDLINYTITHGLSGLQKLAGIPGTVGGAVYGNAGAYGQTISDRIVNITVINSSVIPAQAGIQLENKLHGSRCRKTRLIRSGMTKEDCQFNYRDSIFKKNHNIILEVTFQLEPGNPAALAEEAKETMAKRLIKYPPGIKCPGSFFKNIVAETLSKDILDKIPPGKIVYGKLPAGSLLEEAGAKGKSLDGIEISPNHANLFINKDGGTAKAFCELARIYAQKVKEKFDITLEPEVQLINLPPLI